MKNFKATLAWSPCLRRSFASVAKNTDFLVVYKVNLTAWNWESFKLIWRWHLWMNINNVLGDRVQLKLRESSLRLLLSESIVFRVWKIVVYVLICHLWRSISDNCAWSEVVVTSQRCRCKRGVYRAVSTWRFLHRNKWCRTMLSIGFWVSCSFFKLSFICIIVCSSSGSASRDVGFSIRRWIL